MCKISKIVTIVIYILIINQASLNHLEICEKQHEQTKFEVQLVNKDINILFINSCY